MARASNWRAATTVPGRAWIRAWISPFPREGNYYVEVTDARFSTQAQNFYRLKMGSYRYADGIFPLGGPRGEQTQVTFFGGRAGAGAHTTVDLRNVGAADAFTRVALPDSPALPFIFAVSDLPEFTGACGRHGARPERGQRPSRKGRRSGSLPPEGGTRREAALRNAGARTRHVAPGGIITAYDAAGKKLDSAGDQPLPEDVFAVQGTSRTSSDPFLNLTVPPNVHEIVLTVEDLARRGGPAYGYRLTTRRQAEDFRLSLGSPFVNLPAGGTVVFSVIADRRGFDGPIQLTVADLPKGIRVDGGIDPARVRGREQCAHVQPARHSDAYRRARRLAAHRSIASLGRGQAGRRHRAAPPRARIRPWWWMLRARPNRAWWTASVP